MDVNVVLVNKFINYTPVEVKVWHFLIVGMTNERFGLAFLQKKVFFFDFEAVFQWLVLTSFEATSLKLANQIFKFKLVFLFPKREEISKTLLKKYNITFARKNCIKNCKFSIIFLFHKLCIKMFNIKLNLWNVIL